MAGGATSPPCTDAAAAAASVYTGFASPIASTQLLIIGWLTGSRPSRGRLGPAATIRAAASRIASSALTAAVVCGVPPFTSALISGVPPFTAALISGVPPFTAAPGASPARPWR